MHKARDEETHVKEAIRATLIFSAIAILAGIFGCISGAATGDTPPIIFGSVAIACGLIMAVLVALAIRKGSR
jgi:predicted RND superfamily exporter protein